MKVDFSFPRCGVFAGLAASAAERRAGLDCLVTVVLGTQWGDEGKGKLVDVLAAQ